jgi:hypothetical protein
MGLRGIGALVVCSLFACGWGSSGDAGADQDGGAGRDGAGAGANAAGTDGGNVDEGGDGTGGAPGNCQDCTACVRAECAMDITTCEDDPGCSAIWQCALGCTMPLHDCVLANATGYFFGGPTIAACANRSCASAGCPY